MTNSYIEQPARIVAQIFRGMSEKEKNDLRDLHHVLFYNLEDLMQMVDILDGSKEHWLKQKKQAEKVLEGL